LVKYQNQWLLMELEAIEPELFLPIAPQASIRLAAAIKFHLDK